MTGPVKAQKTLGIKIILGKMNITLSDLKICYKPIAIKRAWHE
jgi:hypothetical protein